MLAFLKIPIAEKDKTWWALNHIKKRINVSRVIAETDPFG